MLRAALNCAIASSLVGVASCDSTTDSTTVEIAPGVNMTRANLGTCCGSEAVLSVPAWLAVGGRGIDTAFDYGSIVPGGKQSEVRDALAKSKVPRNEIFITTKIPAGYGVATGFCVGGAAKVLRQVEKDVEELGTTPDLVLLHAPCELPRQNIEIWRGLESALAQNLTRAIGVSNYNVADLKALLAEASVKPAVNQCLMSVGSGANKALAFTLQQGITFEAFEAMRGCPFDNKDVQAIASNHNTGISNVCLRWVLQKGAVFAVGLGQNGTTIPTFAKSNIGVFSFQLTDLEMAVLDKISE